METHQNNIFFVFTLFFARMHLQDAGFRTAQACCVILNSSSNTFFVPKNNKMQLD